MRRLGVICIHRQNSWWMESGEEMWRGGSEPSLRWAAILSDPCKHRHSSCSRLEGSRHPGTRSNAGACSLTRAIAPSRRTRDSAPLSTSLSNRLVHLREGLPRLYKPVLEELRELVCWAYLFLGVLSPRLSLLCASRCAPSKARFLCSQVSRVNFNSVAQGDYYQRCQRGSGAWFPPTTTPGLWR